MGRLRLLGEPAGGGTDDHSALSNLDYVQSGHTGFVPSQGEAIIDILRLNQNAIRDSEGNDRITLSTASPHITLADEVKVNTALAVGAPPFANTAITCNPTFQASGNMTAVGMNPSFTLTGGMANIYGFQGNALGTINPGATALTIAGLFFTGVVAGGGTAQDIHALWARVALTGYYGPAPRIWGAKFRRPMFMASTHPSDAVGIEIEDMGYQPGTTHNAIGLKIGDQTTTTGDKHLIEAGPSTPYLRLVGGSNPPTDKSNLYLKFGSALYRVIKAGNYVTLEAA